LDWLDKTPNNVPYYERIDVEDRPEDFHHLIAVPALEVDGKIFYGDQGVKRELQTIALDDPVTLWELTDEN
jgi:hypothetical protein